MVGNIDLSIKEVNNGLLRTSPVHTAAELKEYFAPSLRRVKEAKLTAIQLSEV